MNLVFETLQEIVKDTYLIEEILYRLEDVFERAEEDEQYYKALYQLAIYYHKISHLEAAIQLLSRLYQISPHRKVIYALAKLYYEFAEYEVAFEWITRLESNALQYKPALLKARILFEMGEVEQAKEILLQLIKQFPTEQFAYQLVAEIYEQQQLFEQAERYYRILYDYFDTSVSIRTKILEMMLYKEFVDIEVVKNLVKDVEQLSTQEAYLLALIYQRGKELPQAICYAELATESDIDFIEGHLLLMELYTQIEEIDKLTEEIAWLSRTIPPFDDRILEVLPFAKIVHYYEETLLNKLEDYYWICTNVEEAYKVICFIVMGTLYTKDAQLANSLLTKLGQEYFTEEELSYLYGVVYSLMDGANGLEYFKIAQDQAIADEDLVNEIIDLMLAEGLIEHAVLLQAKKEGESHD